MKPSDKAKEDVNVQWNGGTHTLASKLNFKNEDYIKYPALGKMIDSQHPPPVYDTPVDKDGQPLNEKQFFLDRGLEPGKFPLIHKVKGKCSLQPRV